LLEIGTEIHLETSDLRKEKLLEIGTEIHLETSDLMEAKGEKPLKDDDEFEDFQAEDWDESMEDHSDANLWQDDWDDGDDLSDEFSLQLRAELQKEEDQKQLQ